ncbi:ROK family protein [Actinomadura kijaniata]|uniref:ROK family protein n=1 Tax=Actinomadura kijaniata TaxID=46161 RepID=UPI00082E9AA3|nr:ROK family protein [Actinomadura kijaniata]
MNTFVALDVGGTSMKGGLVAADGTVLLAESRSTGRERGPDAVVTAVGDFAAELAERAGNAPVAAGVAVPGIVDEAAGTAVYSANLGWRDTPLRALLEARLGMPVGLGHDVRTGGLGEAAHGAGRGRGDFLFVPLGTGIAAAMIINGSPYPGATGAGGEIGHMVVRPGGEACACGQAGCLEVYSSASALPRRYGDASLRTEDVLARAAAGDPVAARVWEEALDALADALTAATMLLDPSLVVLGGGLAGSGERLTVPLADRLAARFTFREPPPLALAELGAQAAMHGAAILAARALNGSNV